MCAGRTARAFCTSFCLDDAFRPGHVDQLDHIADDPARPVPRSFGIAGKDARGRLCLGRIVSDSAGLANHRIRQGSIT